MAIPRIYCAQKYATGDKVWLASNANRHLLKALRLKPGASVVLFNGRGGEFQAVLRSIDDGQACIDVGDHQVVAVESFLNIHLVYGLARFEKTDWVIQKATELGVKKITPIMTHHGEIHLNAKAADARLERWRAIAIAACEQSGRCCLPEIEKPLSFKAWIKDVYSGTKLIFHPERKLSLSAITPSEKIQDIILLVGPEGGFSEEEVKQAIQHGYQAVSLGPRILRTETAAISAMTTVQLLWGDLLS